MKFNTAAVIFQLWKYKDLWYYGLIMYQRLMRSVGSNGETAMGTPGVSITTLFITNPAWTGTEPKPLL